MDEHAVVVVGGGPTGLMLAGELALAGTDVVVVERRRDQSLDGSRSGGLHARTVEVLDQRGIADRFVAAGTRHPAVAYAGITLDISDFPTRHPFTLGLWQRDFEPILAAWVEELGVPVLRGRAVTGITAADGGVVAEVSDGPRLHAQYLVGCDGGRSLVRPAAGIDAVGEAPTTSWLTAEVDMDGEPRFGFHHDATGTHAMGPLDDGTVRLVLTEVGVDHPEDPDEATLRAELVRVYGTDFGLRRTRWVSRFTDRSSQAVTYRNGPVLLAGDAAHVHPPQGGQGLNTGVQDAANLGWKLALVVAGHAPDSLLDSYHDERHPVAARVLHNTMAQVALGRPDVRSRALRETVVDLLAHDGPRRRIVGMLSGLDIHYDLGAGHPLLGRRVPDLDLHTDAGPSRVHALLHDARAVLLELSDTADVDVRPWGRRVRRVRATTGGPWVLPVLGEVEAPTAVLVRPDGHVGWVGTAGGVDGLHAALTRWCGVPGGE